jgi:hypothetical protein
MGGPPPVVYDQVDEVDETIAGTAAAGELAYWVLFTGVEAGGRLVWATTITSR